MNVQDILSADKYKGLFKAYGGNTDKGDFMDSYTVELPDGYHAIASYQVDTHAEPPWEDDGHGKVITSTEPLYDAHLRLMYEGNRHYVYYDMADALDKAIKEEWGADAGNTPTERAFSALKKDYNYLREYANGSWCYVVATVSLYKGDERVDIDTCGRVEMYEQYHKDFAAEEANAMYKHHCKLRRTMWRAALKEARERRHWAVRGVITTKE